MDARTRVGRRGSKVQAFHRRPVAEIRERRPEEKLLREASAATTKVAADKILVHCFQVGRGMNCPSLDQAAKSGCESLNPLFDAVRKSFALTVPSPLEVIGH